MHLLTVALLGAFLFVEARHLSPLIPMRLLRHVPFAITMGANLVLHMTMMASCFLMPVLIERGLEMPSGYTAALVASIMVFNVGLAPVSGWLYDRTRWLLLTPAAMTIVAAAFLELGLVDTGASLTRIMVIGSVLGVGAGFFLTANNTIAMGMLGPADCGFASGMVGTTTQLGHAVAVSLAGLLMSGALGGQRHLRRQCTWKASNGPPSPWGSWR